MCVYFLLAHQLTQPPKQKNKKTNKKKAADLVGMAQSLHALSGALVGDVSAVAAKSSEALLSKARAAQDAYKTGEGLAKAQVVAATAASANHLNGVLGMFFFCCCCS